MNTGLIFPFLKDIASNNNREWFHANRGRYDAAHEDFLHGVAQAIAAITEFDPSVCRLAPKDCVYRFYRDIRFSPDKSPYKRHFGALISAKGKKALHGGYYIHLQPGNSFIAAGTYWLPTNILTSCRNEIMANIDEWRDAVESERFQEFFGRAGEGQMADYTDSDAMAPKGFGGSNLKKAPKDFPSDYEFLSYLRMKDYCCWHTFDDGFFEGEGWIEPVMEMFRTAKPMVDFINAVVDDYE